MINLRYHIVSLTAVFLALGIGLTLGSSFLDRVTVETLERQLTTVEGQVRETRSVNSALDQRVDDLEDLDAAFGEQLPERLLSDQLAEVPVLVVATQGTDDDLVARAVATLTGSGAEVAGTWWVTDRWGLDDEGERADLAAALSLSGGLPDRLRRSATVRLADVLLAAAAPVVVDDEEDPEGTGDPDDPDAEDPDEPGGGATDPDTTDPDPASQPAESAFAAELRSAGFLDYQQVPGVDGDQVLLPVAGMRVVVVATDEPGTPAGDFLAGLVVELAGDGVAPVLVAQGPADLGEDASDGDARTTFVGPIRSDDVLTGRVATVDNLETTAGLAGLVLALGDLVAGEVGHYGLGPGAGRLLPSPRP